MTVRHEPAPRTATEAVGRVTAAYRTIGSIDRPEVWIHLRDEADALADARAVDERVAAGADLPFAGTVFAVKDNIDVAGLPTTAAHPDFAYVARRSATAVRRLLDAGAVVLGKTNLDQFATGLSGARSPYGAVSSAVYPNRVAGGSSSGSAVATALGQVDFALGTDTAGSGRVPAALNEIVGVKPTPGLVPLDGVVPACASFDCVSVFAPELGMARAVLTQMVAVDADAVGARPWPADAPLAASARPRVAVPALDDLVELSAAARLSFESARDRLRRHADVAEIELTPFRAAAELLYGGGLVAERYAAFGEFLAQHTESADPSVAKIAASAGTVSAQDYLSAWVLLGELRAHAETLLLGFDALLLPTVPRHPTNESITADPIGVNGELGIYTNFVNLFRMAAVAIPADRADGGCFGVTVVARPFADNVAADIAARTQPGSEATEDVGETVVGDPHPLVVFGAHLRGEPLESQLRELGARYVQDVTTAPDRRMYLLPGEPAKPAVVPAEHGLGVSLPGEEWLLSPGALGRLLASLPEPMTLGRLTLADGRSVLGFSAAVTGVPDVEDITAYEGWRAFRRATAP